MNKYFFIFSFFIFPPYSLLSQVNALNIDSLVSTLSILDQEDTSRMNTLVSISHYYENSNLDSALYYADQAIAILDKVPPEFKINGLQVKVRMHIAIGDYKNVIPLLEQAISISLSLDSKFGIVSLYNSLAQAYQEKGQFKLALEHYQNCLDYTLEKNIINRIAICNNMANVYADLGENSKAEIFYLKAEELAHVVPNGSNFSVIILNGLGTVYQEQKKFDLALASFQKSLHLADSLGYAGRMATALNSMGMLYQKLGRYDESLIHLKKAFEIYQKLGGIRGMADTYGGIGTTLLAMNDAQGAIRNCTKALELNMTDEYLLGQMLNTDCLYLAFRKEKDFQQSLTYHERWKILHDSVFSAEKAKEITQLTLNYEFEKEKEAIAIQQKQQEMQLKAETKQAQMLTFGIGLLALFGFGFFWYTRRKNSIISQQNNRLEELNATKDRIFAIIGHDLRKPALAFRGIARKVNFLLKNEEYDTLNKLGESIEKDALALNKLTDNLLNWALIEKDIIPHHPTNILVDELIEEVTSGFSNVAANKHIQLHTVIPKELQLYADYNACQTIIRNLIDNALKYTDEGGEVILKAIDQGKTVQIEVADTGIGIAEDNLKSIFKLQKGKSNKGTAGEKGTGLGIHLAYQLVQLNHGRIEVISKPGKGTRFTVTLPKTAA